MHLPCEKTSNKAKISAKQPSVIVERIFKEKQNNPQLFIQRFFCITLVLNDCKKVEKQSGPRIQEQEEKLQCYPVNCLFLSEGNKMF